MKYKATNELDNFQFHDAVIVTQKCEHDTIIWKLSNLNVTTKVSICDFEEDMCIKEAWITFEHVIFKEISICEEISADIEKSHGTHHFEWREKPLEMVEQVLQDTKDNNDAWISCMFNNIDLGSGCFQVSFEIDNKQELYVITFLYRNATIEWDNYCGTAWYMQDGFKRQQKEEVNE